MRARGGNEALGDRSHVDRTLIEQNHQFAVLTGDGVSAPKVAAHEEREGPHERGRTITTGRDRIHALHPRGAHGHS